MQITNNQPGPRGVNAIVGPVLIDAGQTVEVEVYAREKAHLEASGWFTIEGDYTADPGAAAAAAPVTGDGAKAQLLAKEGEIADLKRQLAAKDKEIADLKKPALKGPFVAKEKSPGWFSIFDADGNPVGKAFRETDATAFNALDDAGKLKAAEEALKVAA